MPKVKLTNKQGLHAVPGSGFLVEPKTEILAPTSMNGATMVGSRNRVVVITDSDYGDDSSQYHLSASDSGTTFVLGDISDARTIVMPAVAAGWNARFAFTGSLTTGGATTAAAITLTGSNAAEATWVGSAYEVEETQASESITVGGTAGVTFNAVGSNDPIEAGDWVEVLVLGSSAGCYTVKGVTGD